MEKSLRLTSKFVIHKRKYAFLEDRISQLPDDILAIILSSLTMKEAARTSILSRRWKNVWTFITGSLDFDAWKLLSTIRKNEELWESLGAERIKYVSWVNQIVDSHKGGTINEFSVSFDLDTHFRSDIDKWIHFAIQKRVRRLEVNLQRVAVNWFLCYPFPAKLLLGNPNAHFLTALKLNFVDVTGQILEDLLIKCPFLEILQVSSSPYLVSLNVWGASLKLKCLEITSCHHFKLLEISAINLTSLKYYGPQAKLRLTSVPNLATVSFGGLYCGYVTEKLRKISRLPLSQIDTLLLDLGLEKFYHFHFFPKFWMLKHLELRVTANDHHSLLSCTNLLKGCPMLYSLTVEFVWFGPRIQRDIWKTQHKPKSLKVLELRGFQGRSADVELAKYLFRKAISLEKVTIDTRKSRYLVGPSQEYEEEDEETLAAKECARQLARKVSLQAELYVI